MDPFDQLAKKGRAFSVLRALRLHEPEPMKMSQFTKASHQGPESAARLRRELEAWGLVEVETLRRQGATEILDIRLTPLGREVAQRLVEAADVLEGAREGRQARAQSSG